jgi:S-formylglutathione hydrolase FrmB
MYSRKLILLVLLLTLAATTFAQKAAPAKAGHLVEVKISAPSLKNNILSDPIEQPVAIYLPPSYDTAPTKRFPVVYLLHGFTGSLRAWTTHGYQDMRLASTMDELIANGRSREMIVVVPNGRNSYGGAFYTNSSTTGNWEDYMTRDLINFVDTNYRTIARAQSRGIVGHSMGGYGALVLSMKHPDLFSAVYALSPCCMSLDGDFGPENPGWQNVIRLQSKDQLKANPETFADFYALAFVAAASAFSPNPEHKPFFADFPYEERDGRVQRNEEVYAKWKAKFPLYMVEEHKGNLLKLRGIFVDYGQKEEFSHIQIGVRMFSNALAERGIPHSFEIYEGADHGSKIRQRIETRVFAFFSEILDFEPAK